MVVTGGDVSMQHTCTKWVIVTTCIPTAACMAYVKRLSPTSVPSDENIGLFYVVIPGIHYDLVEKQKWISNF